MGRTGLRVGQAALALLLMTGCAGLAGSPVPAPPERESPIAELLRERETQLMALRKQLAAAQIASAKREADVAALREQVAQLRREGIESRQLILELRQAVDASSDDLGASLPRQDGTVASQATPKPASPDPSGGWRPAFASLTQEVEQLKETLAKAMVKPQEVPQGASADMQRPHRELTVANHAGSPLADGEMMVFSAIGSAGSSDRSAPVMDRITVEPGDSLWSLARKHRTTVGQLRRDNQLRTDRLEVGQMLLLATP